MTLLQDLGTSGAGTLRRRFEQMVTTQSGFAEVRLREGTADGRPPQGEAPEAAMSTATSIAVPWRGGEAALDISTTPHGSASEDVTLEDERLAVVRAAVPLAALVLDAERALSERASLPRADPARPEPASPEPGGAEPGGSERTRSARPPSDHTPSGHTPSDRALSDHGPSDHRPAERTSSEQSGAKYTRSGHAGSKVSASQHGEAERAAWEAPTHAATARGPVPVDPSRPPCRLTGSGAEMTKLRGEIERAARTDFAVLIEGETGAGKEMVANQIHQWSRRRNGPWIAVNCAALVDSLVESELFGIEDRTATGVRGRRGKIELAHGGTLFLDEVAELTPQVQAKLLRVLQDFTVERVGSHEPRRVNARLIVATNRNLAPLVAERAFRSDLFYRVNLLRIHVPPLRERLTDIVDLSRSFLSEHRELGISRISPAALEVMWTYAWPGNVRELFNVLADAITRAMTRDSREIVIADLPEVLSQPYREVLQPSIERGDTMRAWAGRYVRLVLERCGNNKTKACERLGISYHTLQAHLTQTWPKPRNGPAPANEDPGDP